MCTMHVYVNQLINSSIDLPGAQSVSPTPGSSQSSACSNVDPNHG